MFFIINYQIIIRVYEFLKIFRFLEFVFVVLRLCIKKDECLELIEEIYYYVVVFYYKLDKINVFLEEVFWQVVW